jgi:hypothetical protein
MAGSMQVRQLADQVGLGEVLPTHTRHVDLLPILRAGRAPGAGLILRRPIVCARRPGSVSAPAHLVGLWVARTLSPYGLDVVVEEAAESVISERPDDRSAGWGPTAGVDSAIGVDDARVVLEVLPQDDVEVSGSGDQEMVEDSRRRVPMNRSAIAFAHGACTGVRMTRTSAWMSAIMKFPRLEGSAIR